MSLLTGLGASLAVVVAGWAGASGEAELTDQYPWLAVAIVGCVVAGVMNARWLLVGLVALRARERELLAPLLPAAGAGRPHTAVLLPAAEEQVVVVTGLPAGRYHLAGCAAVAGRLTDPMNLTDAQTEGREPCGLCSAR